MSNRRLFVGLQPVLLLVVLGVLASCKTFMPSGHDTESSDSTPSEPPKRKAESIPSDPASADEDSPTKKSWLSRFGRKPSDESIEASSESAQEELQPGKDMPLQLRDDANVLLAMSFEEAKQNSPQHLVIPPHYRVAADQITVLQSDTRGRPLRVSAKGKVFLEIDFDEKIIALAQEAYIEANRESIVRGRPLLKRGMSVIEGLSDYTAYYIRGSRLQAIGRHRVLKQEYGYVASRKGGVSGGGGAAFNGPMPMWNVTPNWNQAWQDGPNPLLPALTPHDIPSDLRATPLVPPTSDSADLPPPPLGSEIPEPNFHQNPAKKTESSKTGEKGKEEGDAAKKPASGAKPESKTQNLEGNKPKDTKDSPTPQA